MLLQRKAGVRPSGHERDRRLAVLILADGTTPIDWVVLDLFSQAEHDSSAQSILISPDPAYVAEVVSRIEAMLPAMERESIIRQSLLQRGAVILCSDKREALELANRVAPEHLELAVAEPQEWIDQIRHAGAIFCGAHTGETFGDYVAGPSHVLPTFGTARFASPQGVYDFQKRTSVVEMSARGASELSAVTDILAQSEGLSAHAQAAQRAVALTIVRLLPTAQARLSERFCSAVGCRQSASAIPTTFGGHCC